MPIVTQFILEKEHANNPLIIGIKDVQGSGKTTLAASMVSLLSQHGLEAVDVLKMLQSLSNYVAIPRCNKTHDDRLHEFKWCKASAVDVVIIEDWCLGALT